MRDDLSISYVESDIPAGVTLAQWRLARAERRRRRRVRRLRLRLA
jgi:hypothetical protein